MRQVRVPPMLSVLIQSAVRSVDGMRFTKRDECPVCNSPVREHDIRRKRFATVLEEEGRKKSVTVFVTRFYCTGCGRLIYAESPFYPGTRLGSPLVDFCIANRERYPFHHLARILEEMNIIVDRGTIRNYARRHFGQIKAIEMYGMMIPLSLLSLSERALGGGERSAVIGAESLGPGGLPPAERALFHLVGSLQQGKKGNNQK